MNKKLNVLFLPKWYPFKNDLFDGNFIENYAHAIKDSCRLMVLFVHSDTNQKEPYQIEVLDNNGIQEVRVFFKASNSPFSIINKLLTAIRYRKAQRIGYKRLSASTIDLCHIHVLSRSSLLALWLKRRHKTPFIISEHWSGYQARVGEYKGLFKKWFTKKVVKEAEIVHTVSSPLKEAMMAHGLSNAYEVIPNVVDTQLFQPNPHNNEKTEMLFVGNLLQRPKRILDIIEVFSMVVEDQPNVRLSIYGEGQDEKLCEKRIKEYQLENKVVLKGVRTRSEIAKIMAKSDFLILFSEFENQPCVINEAQACGLPVVVPDIAGIKELMNDQLGICYSNNDKDAFRKALIEMIQNHQNYDQRRIRKFAQEHFSEEVIGNKLLKLYQKALKIEQ